MCVRGPYFTQKENMKRFFRNLWFKLRGRQKQPVKVTPIFAPDLNGHVVDEKIYGSKKIHNELSMLYRTMLVKPIGRQKKGHVNWYMKQMKKNEEMYKDAAKYVLPRCAKVPWQVIGVLHAMEAGFDRDEQILNGQPWNRKTTIVPRDMGPWSSFNESCVAGMEIKDRPRKWTLGATLDFLEKWNGLGYRRKNKNSPYLWAYSNHQEVGKYVRDGVYDPKAVSLQVGAAVLLKQLGFTGE